MLMVVVAAVLLGYCRSLSLGNSLLYPESLGSTQPTADRLCYWRATITVDCTAVSVNSLSV
jgi:hypothetical protein